MVTSNNLKNLRNVVDLLLNILYNKTNFWATLYYLNLYYELFICQIILFYVNFPFHLKIALGVCLLRNATRSLEGVNRLRIWFGTYLDWDSIIVLRLNISYFSPELLHLSALLLSSRQTQTPNTKAKKSKTASNATWHI